MSTSNIPGTSVPVPPRRRGMAREHARPDALAAMDAIQRGPVRRRLLALYRRAAALQLVDQDNRRWPDLSDFEAAAMLGVERTTINAARNALVKDGLVGKCRKRKCRYRPSNLDVWGWALK